MDVVVVTMLFGVLGIMIGYKAGLEGGKTAANDRQYWARNGVALLVGVAVSAVVAATGLLTLVGLSIGLIGGAVAGLKFGYGKSVGLWRKHDTMFRVNKDQVAAADSAKQARDEGMTEEERAKRDLVSVGSAPASRASSAEKNQKKGR